MATKGYDVVPKMALSDDGRLLLIFDIPAVVGDSSLPPRAVLEVSQDIAVVELANHMRTDVRKIKPVE